MIYRRPSNDVLNMLQELRAKISRGKQAEEEKKNQDKGANVGGAVGKFIGTAISTGGNIPMAAVAAGKELLNKSSGNAIQDVGIGAATPLADKVVEDYDRKREIKKQKEDFDNKQLFKAQQDAKEAEMVKATADKFNEDFKGYAQATINPFTKKAETQFDRTGKKFLAEQARMEVEVAKAKSKGIIKEIVYDESGNLPKMYTREVTPSYSYAMPKPDLPTPAHLAALRGKAEDRAAQELGYTNAASFVRANGGTSTIAIKNKAQFNLLKEKKYNELLTEESTGKFTPQDTADFEGYEILR